MSTKMAVAFANIYMAAIITQILSQSSNTPLEWKRDIDDVFSLWDRQEIEHFIDWHGYKSFSCNDNKRTANTLIVFISSFASPLLAAKE